MKKIVLLLLFVLLVPNLVFSQSLVIQNTQSLLTQFLNVPEDWLSPSKIIWFIFIPFLGTFTIIWGILTSTKAKIFEKPKVNVLLSFVFAVSLFYSGILPAIVLYLFAYGGVFGVIAFFVLFFVLTTLFGYKKIGKEYNEAKEIYNESKKIAQKEKDISVSLGSIQNKIIQKQKEKEKIKIHRNKLVNVYTAIRDHMTAGTMSQSMLVKIKRAVVTLTHRTPSGTNVREQLVSAIKIIQDERRKDTEKIDRLAKEIMELETQYDTKSSKL
jgi:hypothetical protein